MMSYRLCWTHCKHTLIVSRFSSPPYIAFLPHPQFAFTDTRHRPFYDGLSLLYHTDTIRTQPLPPLYFCPLMTSVFPRLQRALRHIIDLFDSVVSFLILLAILATLWYLFVHTLNLALSAMHMEFRHTVHDVAFIVVLVKAYKILAHYLSKHHVSIRYLLEVAIIAPMIEVIFVSDAKVWWLSVLYAGFSLACLLLYLVFYKTITQIK